MVSRIGLVSFLFRVQLTTCKFTFKNLKEFILQNIFLQIQSYMQLQVVVDHEKWFQDNLWDC